MQGFRKVDPDRWQFANEYFLRGRRDLLGEIHRRKPAGSERGRKDARSGGDYAALEVGVYGGLQAEVDALKRDKTLLMQEVIRLRHAQKEAENEMQALSDRIEMTEQRQQQMIAFFAQALQHPALVQHFVASSPAIKRIEDGRRRKKRKGESSTSEQQDDSDTEVAGANKGVSADALVVHQQNSAQGLADLAKAFMQMMNTSENGQPSQAGHLYRSKMGNQPHGIDAAFHSKAASDFADNRATTGFSGDKFTGNFNSGPIIEEENSADPFASLSGAVSNTALSTGNIGANYQGNTTLALRSSPADHYPPPATPNEATSLNQITEIPPMLENKSAFEDWARPAAASVPAASSKSNLAPLDDNKDTANISPFPSLNIHDLEGLQLSALAGFPSQDLLLNDEDLADFQGWDSAENISGVDIDAPQNKFE